MTSEMLARLGLTQGTISTAVNLVLETLEEEVATIAITGSRAAGLANDRSDIDIIVVLDQGEEDRYYQSWMVDGKALEALIVSSRQASKICSAIGSEDYRVLDLDTRDLVLKFLYAVPIHSGDALTSLLGGWTIEQTILRWVRVQRHYALKNYNDITNAIEDQDFLLAAEAYRNLIRNEVDALLCSFGDVYSRSKRQAQRVKRVPQLSERFFDKYLRYCYNIGLEDISGLRIWIEEALAFHKEIQTLLYESLGFVKSPTKEVHTEKPQIVSTNELFLAPINEHEWMAKSRNRSIAVGRDAARLLLLSYRLTALSTVAGSLSAVIDEDGGIADIAEMLIERGLLMKIE